MKKVLNILTFILLGLCLVSCEYYITDEKYSYYLNDILGFESELVTKITYGDSNEEADLKETIKLLDTKYELIDDTVDVDLVDCYCSFKLYKNEVSFTFYWLANKIVYVESLNGRYFSRDQIDLFKLNEIPEEVYTLDDVLGYKKSLVTDITCSYHNLLTGSYEKIIFDLEETIALLDIEYTKKDSGIEGTPLCTIYIESDEGYTLVRCFENDVTYIETPDSFYFPKETIILDLSFVNYVFYLSSEEKMLSDLESSNVIEIAVETGYIGVAPGSPTIINKTTDRDEITRLVTAWKFLKMKLCTDDSWAIDGGGFQMITFTFNNGKTYSIYIANDYYSSENRHYQLLSFPTIIEDKITSTEEGTTK